MSLNIISHDNITKKSRQKKTGMKKQNKTNKNKQQQKKARNLSGLGKIDSSPLWLTMTDFFLYWPSILLPSNL